LPEYIIWCCHWSFSMFWQFPRPHTMLQPFFMSSKLNAHPKKLQVLQLWLFLMEKWTSCDNQLRIDRKFVTIFFISIIDYLSTYTLHAFSWHYLQMVSYFFYVLFNCGSFLSILFPLFQTWEIFKFKLVFICQSSVIVII